MMILEIELNLSLVTTRAGSACKNFCKDTSSELLPDCIWPWTLHVSPKVHNVNDGEADQMGKRIKNSTLLRSIRPPTNYNNTITLAFRCILLVIFLLLFLDFGIYSFRRSPLFRLSL